MVIRSKRTVGWLNNRRMMNPPKLYSNKGLTQEQKPATVNAQLEFSFMRAS